MFTITGNDSARNPNILRAFGSLNSKTIDAKYTTDSVRGLPTIHNTEKIAAFQTI